LQMIKSGSAPRLAPFGATIQSLARFKWVFSLVIALLVTVAATPPPGQANPDEQYIKIMAIIDKADALRAAGQADAARAKYAEAERALLVFKANNPLFAPKTVAYRLKIVTERADARPPVVTPTNSSTAKPKAKAETEPAAAAVAKGGVKLLEPGAEPRNVLRYHPKPGDKQTAVMTVKIKMDMPMPAGPGGAAAAMPTIPTMNIPMDITVQSIAANGDITFESVMGEATLTEEPGIAPEVIQGMKTALTGIKGLSTVGVLSSRGITKKMDMKAPPNENPQMRQFMDQIKEGTGNMGVPFPEEPVGAGAKWEAVKPSKMQAMTVNQTGNYELVSVEGDKVSTKFTMNFDAANQKGQAPAPGQPDVLQMNGKANGTSNLDLSRLLGTSAKFDMHMEMKMEMTMGNQKRPMDMKMDMNMSLDTL
jgi:hypothetical protein